MNRRNEKHSQRHISCVSNFERRSAARIGDKALKSNILSFSIVLMVILSVITTSVQAQDVKSWSTAGSTGTADKVDLNKIVYSNGIVAFPEIQVTQSSARRAAGPQLQTVQAVIRYNVTAADGLFFDSGRLCMVVRFRDDGNRARVFLRLIRLSVSDGTSATLLTFDSNSFSPQQDFQTNSVGTNRVPFDFSQNAYYVEATLTKQQPIVTTFGAGRPALAVVVLTRCNPIT